jgi:DNA mismatch endonuclease (patch repair protein)
MADIKSKEERSKNMSAIKSKDTKPELFLRKLLFSKGYRYSLYSKKVPGHPDLYMRKYNTAVFVHGCFWHRHEGCKYAYTPKSKADFWNQKFLQNTGRDKRVREELKNQNFRQLVIWECTIKRMKKDKVFENIMCEKIVQFLNSDEGYREL